MSHSSPAAVLGRLAALDTAICLRLRAGSNGPIRAVMVWASRAGDGWAWLALAIALPVVAGPSGWSLLIALSRLALSLHYPSDVAAGAALGALIAWAVL